ncbi:SLC13 family permease [Robiginitalea aurantiaca]|uniref:DASS family sodium-coupled anion symporter n=1 Tax=Robiginitalea aurantiaca TaxID=3056915 RepID=A0ABT7WDI1_9FLAO|nr:DASS family sodium-coupled anion symporter [Robiginitalea aurantiaca]MDM9630972.1 DASS family sodium-coupled anion symporter [Robiginitalea aurantiaca]
MADSRTASLKLLPQMQKVVDIQSKIIYFLLAIILAFGLTYALYEPVMNQAQIYVLFLLFLAVGLWVTEAIPPFAVGLLVFGFLIFAMNSYYSKIDPENVQSYYSEYVNSWSSSVIWLMLGGFFMAEAMRKTGLDKEVFRMSIAKFGTNPKYILLGMMLTTALFSMIMSNTATAAMMIASVMPFISTLEDDAPFTKASLLGISGAASLGGMGTLIGSPPNAIAVEALNTHGIDVGFLEWMLVGFPLAIILTLVFWFLLIRKYIPRRTEMHIELPSEETAEYQVNYRFERIKKRVVLIVMGLTLLLWLTEKAHGIPASVVSLLPIILLTMSGIINGDDVRHLPWDTLMLVAGGLALGLAIKETGLADLYVEKIQQFDLNFYVMVLGFGFLTIFMSNVMSNTATATILIPVGIILTFENPVILPIVIGLSASSALFLPISTPPNAIAYSTGKLEQKDFRLGGVAMGFISPILITVFAFIIYALVT